MTAQQAKQVVKNALYRTIGETSTALRLRPGDAAWTLFKAVSTRGHAFRLAGAPQGGN